MPVSQKFELALILKESTVLTGTKANDGLHYICIQKSNNYFTYAFVKVICLLYKNYIHLEFAFVFVLNILMVFRGSIHCTIQICMIIRGSIHFELSSEGVFIFDDLQREYSLHCTYMYLVFEGSVHCTLHI